jgi:hypothetical protein
MNFNTLDLGITTRHLANDDMHVHFHYKRLIFNSVINHFNQVVQAISSTATTTSATSSTPSTTSTTATPTIDEPTASQFSHRTREAIQRRTNKRNQKRKAKRQQHSIKREMCRKWTLIEMEKYLDSFHIKYAHVPQFGSRIIRLQFDNQADQDAADSKLGNDIFNENHYKNFMNNQST